MERQSNICMLSDLTPKEIFALESKLGWKTLQEMRDIETEVNMFSESLSEMNRRYWLRLSEGK
ncbi:MAG: hypothetical protein WA364_09385 [Candidatus Nitrosopolaris sp.]